MSKTPAMFRPFVRYAEFNGRSNRVEFWSFVLLIYIVAGAFAAAMYSMSLKDGQFNPDLFLPNYLRFSPFVSLFNLGILVPMLAVRVRRLHDIGRTGWWIIAPYVVSIIAYIVFFMVKGEQVFAIMMGMAEKMQAMQADNPMAMMNPADVLKLEWPLFQLMLPWVLIPTFAAELLLLIFMLLPGSAGDNRFGPPPARG